MSRQMKNVLIYLYKSQLQPIGGPKGYNYNLYKQFEKMGVTNIHFIETQKGDVQSIKDTINNIKIALIRNVAIILKSFLRKLSLLYGFRHRSVIDLDKYDVVHFQSTVEMYQCRDSLKSYKGKVVLTSHSPTLKSKEVIDEVTNFEKKYMMWLYKKLIRMDQYAFNRADYIFFPCEEAEEPYIHAWDCFEKIKKQNPSKFKYLLSGIEPCVPKLSNEEIRKKYKIPKDAFVICYVGRHNEIKGYDQLKIIGDFLLKENENVYFLIAGKESPIQGLHHERWIEVGWTNDPHSLVSAANVFVLPNKETYFDLVMLEVLSLGAIVVASKTGGNKYFEKMQPNGIYLYEDTKHAVKILEGLMELPEFELAAKKDLNKKIYEENLTSSKFANSYIELIESL